MNKKEFMRHIGKMLASMDLSDAPVAVKAQQQAIRLTEITIPNIIESDAWEAAYSILCTANDQLEALLSDDPNAPIKMRVFRQEED